MGNKFCTKCGLLLDEQNSRKRGSSNKIHSTCRSCHNEITKFQQRRYKLECMNAYGGPICACCGITQYEFLTIDHIDGGGEEHRRNTSIRGGSQFYLWLKRNKFPPGFRILCMNCNFSLGEFGYCPHKQKSKIDMSILFYSPRKVLTGEAVGTSKLKADQVREIKERLKAGELPKDIARVYDMAKSQVYNIRRNEAWTSVK